MDAIEKLMDEHELILAAIDRLDVFSTDLEAGTGAPAPAERMAHFVDFFTAFADAIHHAKEEDLLFRAMADHGFPVEGGPIAVMLEEHDQGRAAVDVMRDAANAPGDWSVERRAELVATARDYAAMLRAHIDKENNILYVMARDVLPPEAMASLNTACAELDATHSDKIARLRAGVASL